MENDLTFERVASWLRAYRRVPARKAITPETQFERDLGITGDDGIEMLKAAEQNFKVEFENEEAGLRETFNLQPNEYLFNAEGWGPSPAEFIALFSGRSTVINKFTVGELYEAISRIKLRDRSSSER